MESADSKSSLSLDGLSLNSASSSLGPTLLAGDRPTTLLQYALVILKTANPVRKVALTREALAFVRSPELLDGRPLVDAEEGAKARIAVGHETPPREESIGGSVAPGRTGKRGKGGSEKSRNLMLRASAGLRSCTPLRQLTLFVGLQTLSPTSSSGRASSRRQGSRSKDRR